MYCMCTERAMAHCGSSEVLVVGGVACKSSLILSLVVIIHSLVTDPRNGILYYVKLVIRLQFALVSTQCAHASIDMVILAPCCKYYLCMCPSNCLSQTWYILSRLMCLYKNLLLGF